MGGIASGEARRRKRDMASLVSAMLDAPANGRAAKDLAGMFPQLDEDATWAAAAVAGQVRAAMNGSSRSFQALASYKDSADARDLAEDARGPFTADMGLLIGPDFLAAHRAVCAGEVTDLWLRGGRGSLKSSYASLEVSYQLMRHPDWHAAVFMARKNALREAAFSQMLWALDALGVSDSWRANVSPCKLVNVSTGQCVYFRGLDDPKKTKSITPPFGHIAIGWFEEADQLRGMAEVRTVIQSVSRGGDEALRIYTFNPPRTRSCWINERMLALESEPRDGTLILGSSYDHAPREWLGAQFFEDAERLRAEDEEAYRHEYLGEPVGYGAQVFPRAEVRQIGDVEMEAIDCRLFGVDWGFAQDPFVWLEVGYSRRTRTLYILDEITGLGLSNRDSAALVSERMSGAVYEAGYEPIGDEAEDSRHMLRGPVPHAAVVCDSAEPKSIADFREAGIRAEKSPKQGAFDVRNTMRWLQGRSAIVIDPARCPLAAREFALYEHDRTPDGEVVASFPDRDNHAIDAARYACATLIADRSCV